MSGYITEKRKADRGHRILITDAYFPKGKYRNGDILEVKRDEGFGNVTTMCGSPVIFSEYEVIVGEKFEPGDKVRNKRTGRIEEVAQFQPRTCKTDPTFEYTTHAKGFTYKTDTDDEEWDFICDWEKVEEEKESGGDCDMVKITMPDGTVIEGNTEQIRSLADTFGVGNDGEESEEIEKEAEEILVGDTVELLDSYAGALAGFSDGDICEVDRVECDGKYLYRIRKKNTYLTGYTNADNLKKVVEGVEEYEDLAAGDKVKLLSGGEMHPLFVFTDGETYTVSDKVYEERDGRRHIEIIKTSGTGYALPEQLEKVIEDEEDSEYKTESRRAKTGERILITDAVITHGKYEDGDVLTVSKEYVTMEGGTFLIGVEVEESDVPCVSHREYEVIVEGEYFEAGDKVELTNKDGVNGLIGFYEGETYEVINGAYRSDADGITRVVIKTEEGVRGYANPENLKKVEKDPVALAEGDCVKLAIPEGETPKYKWGRVSNGAVGTVRRIGRDDRVFVDFPEQTCWMANRSELVKIEGEYFEAGDKAELMKKIGAGGLFGFQEGEIYEVDDEGYRTYADGSTRVVLKSECGYRGFADPKSLKKVEKDPIKPGDIVRVGHKGTYYDDLDGKFAKVIRNDAGSFGGYDVRIDTLDGTDLDYTSEDNLEKVELSEEEMTFARAGRDLGETKVNDIVYDEERGYGVVIKAGGDDQTPLVNSGSGARWTRNPRLVAKVEDRVDLDE